MRTVVTIVLEMPTGVIHHTPHPQPTNHQDPQKGHLTHVPTSIQPASSARAARTHPHPRLACPGHARPRCQRTHHSSRHHRHPHLPHPHRHHHPLSTRPASGPTSRHLGHLPIYPSHLSCRHAHRSR